MNFGGLKFGLIVGTIIAIFLYFFVLEREAPAQEPVSASIAQNAGAAAPALTFPAKCRIGEACWYMAYVDLDAGARYHDHMCGIRTYDAHKGTDIATSDESIGTVDIVAAADGKVIGTRDGLIDTPMRDNDPAREATMCGNGVRIDHGGGWTTQYCHMARNSVAVRKGATVAAGTVLGRIGSSGWSETAHLHFQLEKDGVPVDPFTSRRPAQGPQCTPSRGREMTLWRDPATANANFYRPVHIRRVGLTTDVPERRTAKFEGYPAAAKTDAEALVAYVVLFGAPKGARIAFEIEGPAGEDIFANTRVLEQGRAEFFAYSGTKRKSLRWPPGVYTARVEVTADGPDGPFSTAASADLILR